MSDPDDAVASGLKHRIASSIPLEGGPVVVEGKAVQLNDQLLMGPEGVDLEACNRGVGNRSGQALFLTEHDEAVLQWRAGRHRLPGSRDQTLHWPQGAAPGVTGTDVLDRADLEQAQPVRLLKGALVGLLVDDLGQVEEGASNGGDRDSVYYGTVAWVYPAPMDDHAVFTSAAVGQDFDRRAGANQSPKGGGTAVAQQRTVTACKYGRQPVASHGQPSVANGVDTLMEQVEAAVLYPALNGPTGETRGK